MSTVAIVGGGVAGLQALKRLQQNKRFAPVLFEKAPDVGGLWRDNYPGQGAQVFRTLYEFPGYPMKRFPNFYVPKAEEIREYVKDYCKHYNLDKNIKTNTEITSISKTSSKLGDKWTLTFRNGTKQTFDNLIVACGLYCTPHKPTMKGEENFEGRIVHSMEFKKSMADDLLKGKNVVVVGSCRSAQDIAMNSAKHQDAKKTTMLFRRAHWGAPLYIAGLIPFHYVFLSRFGQALVSIRKGPFPVDDGEKEGLLFKAHALGKTAIAPVFAIVEALFKFQNGYRKDFVPAKDILFDFYAYGHLPVKEITKTNKVDLVQGEIVSLEKNAVRVVGKAGEFVLPCDTLIQATGFEKRRETLFDGEVVKHLNVEEDGMYLYRHIVPPKLKNIYFLGSEVATISNIMTHAVQAKWVEACMEGKIPLSQERMMAEVEKMKKWKRSWMPLTSGRAAFVLLHQTHYHDQLLKDCGVSGKRKGNFLSEALMPYAPRDYAEI